MWLHPYGVQSELDELLVHTYSPFKVYGLAGRVSDIIHQRIKAN
jgi:hypothetical protein